VARLLLGVSGGIAAYKALEVARLAVRAGHVVRVVQTEASLRFVGRASFEAITGGPVLVGEFDADPLRGAYPGEPVPDRLPISHLALVQRADLYLIAPASANTLAKLAGGHADNLLTAAALAADCPVLVAPAMNDRMYRHQATQDNVELLRRRGLTIIPPGEGELASHGERGLGRLAEPADLLAACEAALGAGTATEPTGSWSGRRVLITAGGTREPIDSVRYIGNRSSGRMGVALAQRAVARGADVVLIAASLAVSEPDGARVVRVHTAQDLATACGKEFPAADVLLMAAAVADFRPAAPAQDKLKKENGTPPPIELEPTEDILSALAAQRRAGQILVGFAAEHGADAVSYGRSKLERKGLDAVVVNDISRPDIGFDVDYNEVVILTADGERHVARGPKAGVADEVLDEVQRLLERRMDGGARPHSRSVAGA
jgi:phosphopantothenoylcysteine decarboxylase / phosphopantothenate---cysteine ligase